MTEFHGLRELDERGVPSAPKLTALGLEHLITLLDAR